MGRAIAERIPRSHAQVDKKVGHRGLRLKGGRSAAARWKGNCLSRPSGELVTTEAAFHQIEEGLRVPDQIIGLPGVDNCRGPRPNLLTFSFSGGKEKVAPIQQAPVLLQRAPARHYGVCCCTRDVPALTARLRRLEAPPSELRGNVHWGEVTVRLRSTLPWPGGDPSG